MSKTPEQDPLDEEFTVPDHGLGHTEHLASQGWFLAKYDIKRCATCICRIFKGDWARAVDAGVVCEPCGLEIE